MIEIKTEKLPDWELDAISAEVDKLEGTIPREQHLILTLRMIKALLIDVQEGRVSGMIINAVGEKKVFQWILSESDDLITLMKSLEEIDRALRHSIKLHLLHELKNLNRD